MDKDDTAYSYLNFGAATARGWQIGKSANSGVGPDGGFYIYENTTATPGTRFVIQNAGNVGIGTTGPGYKLDVYTTGINGLRVTDDDVMPTFSMLNGDGAGVEFKIMRAASVFTGAAENDVAFVAPTSRSLRFGQGTTEYMVIKSGGNVGIGTTSPVYTLDITGTGRVTGAFTKGSGTFDIPHPDPEKEKDGWRLRHSFVESPTRGDNLYRWGRSMWPIRPP